MDSRPGSVPEVQIDTSISVRCHAHEDGVASAIELCPGLNDAERVGLRPFRKSGVRIERARLNDGRTVVHNYGHGGAGFTLSWGCADEVAQTVSAIT